MQLKEKERIDDLEYKGLKIIQNEDGFCFGIDSVLLSDFAKGLKANSKVVDIGTGTGIISILLSVKSKAKIIYGVEIQSEVANMAQRSVELNDLTDRVKIINEDIKNIVANNIIEPNTIDCIVTNPPYMELETGATSIEKKKLISRHEIECTIDDIAKVSSKLLKTKGELYMIHRTNRMVDVISALRKYGLEPKQMRFVQSNINKEPHLFMIKCVKNGGKQLKVSLPLIIYNNDGTYTDEIMKIYNKMS